MSGPFDASRAEATSTLRGAKATDPLGAVPSRFGLGPAEERAWATDGGGVYLHIPFCAHRCSYCAFVVVSGGGRGAAEGPSFVRALTAEVATVAGGLPPAPPLRSIFLGGGTPTQLADDDLRTLIGTVRSSFAVDDATELTLEANPEDLSEARLGRLAELGITRLSLGVQSTSPGVLNTLGRIHTPDRGVASLGWARAAGFRSLSADLILGGPGDSLGEVAASVRSLVDGGADHISCYLLSVEPRTRLAAHIRSGGLPPPDPDAAAAAYELVDAMLDAAGFAPYEISNWALTPADRSLHNLLYWRGGNWLGFGPGAHSHVAGLRWWNTDSVSDYLGGATVSGRERPTPTQRRLERIMCGIRLSDGLAVSEVLTGHPDGPREAQEAIDLLVTRDLLCPRVRVDDPLVLTRRGRLVCDSVVVALAG